VDVGVSWLGRVGSALAVLRAEAVNVAPRQILDYSLVRDASAGPSGYGRVERLLPPTAFLLSVRLGL